MKRLILSVLVVLSVCAASRCYSLSLSADRLQAVAEALSSTLHELYNDSLQMSNLHSIVIKQDYAKAAADDSFTARTGTHIVGNLSRHLSDKFAMLRNNLGETSHAVSEMFNSSGCCSEECVGQERTREACARVCDTSNPAIVEYYQAQYGMGSGDGGDGMESGNDVTNVIGLDSFLYSFEHNVTNYSAVHIPLDIYEKDPDVLCFLDWTGRLEEHFHAQSVEVTKVTVQYFGSHTGLLRFYPAKEWALLNQCYRCPVEPSDTFDARRRPWYTNTIAGDVAVVVLLDMSGSMAGFQSLLARLAVGELLSSLSQDDSFLVFRVDGDGTNPFGCFTEVVRAAPENVVTMKHVLMNTKDNEGIADFVPAVGKAVEQLEGRPECHKVIVIFTDAEGGRDISVSLFNHKKLRVFTYRIGRGSDDNHLSEIATKCHGRMGRIRDYGDIFPEIQSFVNILREQSLPTEEEEEGTFFTHYRDVFGGRVLSLSQPVVQTIGNETREVLGVVGVDVQLDTIMLWLWREDLSPAGYAFLVDNNGQLIVHPQINSTYFTLLSADDLISLDVSNYEHAYNSSEFEAVRESIIDRASGVDGTTGQSTLQVWATIDCGRHYGLRNVTYFYTPVNGTPFALVLVLPSPSFEALRYPELTQDDVCPVLPSPFAEQYLNSCNANLSQSSLFNVLVKFQAFALASRDCDVSPDLLGVFAHFSLGLKLCAGYSFSCSPLVCTDLPNYIQLIEEGKDRLIVLTGVVINTSNGTQYVGLVQTVAFTEGNGSSNSSSIPGVLGMVYAMDYFSDILWNITINETGDSWQGSGEEVDVTVVYLVDETMHIAATTGPAEAVGQLFPNVQSQITEDLLSKDVVINATLQGYELRPCTFVQNLGEAESHCDNAGTSLYQGVLITAVWWVLDGAWWATLKVTVMSMLSGIFSFTGVVFGYSGSMGGCHGVDLCLSQTVVYHLNEGTFTVNDTVDCNGAPVSYLAVSVPNMSLLLVAVSSSTCESTAQLNVEECPCPCVCKTPEAYRMPTQRLHQCSGNNTECSSSSSVHPGVFFLLSVSTLLAVIQM